MSSATDNVRSQGYLTALARSVMAYLLIVPVLVFVVDYLVIPVLSTGRWNAASLVSQIGEFVVFFYAAIWGVVIALPMVHLLRARIPYRAAWASIAAAFTLVGLAMLVSPSMAFSAYVVGLIVGGAAFGYAAAKVVEPRA